MSYSISIVDKKTNKTVLVNHDIKGSTYAIGGSNLAEMDITYNYSKYYYDKFGTYGIRSLYGKPLDEAIKILKKVITSFGDVLPSEDYWKPTKGNAKFALIDLLNLCEITRKAYPNEDMSIIGD